jgi:hypothetical protein
VGWLLSLVFNRYTFAAAAAAALAWAGWSWHTSEIDKAVEAAVAARDLHWTGEIEAERARHRGLVADWVLEMVAREDAARVRLAKEKAAREARFRQLLKEVATYVTPVADSRCVVPRGFVLFHDAAAAGDAGPPGAAAVPEPGGGSLDADSGVALSAVGSRVAENYAACHEAIAEVTAWRRWYLEARDSWERLRAQLSHPPPTEALP